MRLGTPRLHLRVVDSTNARARELAETGAPSGTVVTADAQTAGRGRHGRRWAAPPGKALLLSALLSPLDARHGLLPLAVPIAVCEAIESVAPVACAIKWPNDVWICEPEADQGEGEAGQADSGPRAKPWVPGRKAAGVLIEARPPEWAVIGVGVSVAVGDDEFPADLRWPATSVGHGASVAGVRDALCDRLGAWVDAPEPDVLAAFGKRDALRGRSVTWEGPDAGGSGVARGVDERGNLVVEHEDGSHLSLGSGEVSLSLS